MIGCLQLVTMDEAALRDLRLRLDRLSPRVQLCRAGPMATLLLDLGRGTVRDGRRHAEELARLAGLCTTEPQRAQSRERSGKASATSVALPHGPVCIGVAPMPTLATLAARCGAAPMVVGPASVAGLLARCPVAWLEALAPHELALHGLGLRTLADVAALPAAAVGGRFGGAALRAWRALHGDEPPLTPAPLPPRLTARRAFDGPVGDGATLELALGRLAARLGAALERRGAQASALALHLHTEDGPRSAARLLERPAAGADALAPIAAGLLRAAGAQGGVEAVVLLAGELVVARGEQLTLFAPTGERRDVARAAIADLAARLGPGGLVRASVVPPGAALAEERAHFTPWGPP